MGLIAAGIVGCGQQAPADVMGGGDTASDHSQPLAEHEDAQLRVDTDPAADTVRSTLTLSFRGRGPYRELRAIRIKIGQGKSARHLTGADFNITRPGDKALRSTARLFLPSSGRMPIQVALVAGMRDTIGVVRTDLELRPGHAYGLNILAGWPPLAASYCGGKEFDRVAPLRAGARSVKLRPREYGPPLVDSLFVRVSAIDQRARGRC